MSSDLRPSLTVQAKALVVEGGGVVGSFALAWLLINRIPGVGRVL
ncbi:MAG TPA: hypothetical protein VF082_10380 [Jiangellaceae bacterium]